MEALLQSKLKLLLDCYTDKRWESVNQSNEEEDVKVYVNKEEPLYKYMGITNINTCLSLEDLGNKITDLMQDEKIMKEWNPKMVNMRVIQNKDDIAMIYASYAFNNPIIKNRDFLFANKLYSSMNKIHSVNTSVDSNKFNDDNYVRGKICLNAWTIEKTKDSYKYRMYYLLQVDPSGYLPSVLINSISVDRVKMVALVKKYIQERYPHK